MSYSSQSLLQPHPRLRILVADDNTDLAQSLAMLLEYNGHETRTAYDGLEATEVAAIFRPDLMLLDIEMPRLDGYEVTRWIRAQPWGRRILIAAISGAEPEKTKGLALDVGIDQYFTKPIEPRQLSNLVECAAHAG